MSCNNQMKAFEEKKKITFVNTILCGFHFNIQTFLKSGLKTMETTESEQKNNNNIITFIVNAK